MVVDDVLGGRESGLVALRGRQRERRQQPRSDDPCHFRTSQIAVNYVLTQLQTTTRSVKRFPRVIWLPEMNIYVVRKEGEK